MKDGRETWNLGERWEVPFFEFFAMGIIFDSTDHKIR